MTEHQQEPAKRKRGRPRKNPEITATLTVPPPVPLRECVEDHVAVVQEGFMLDHENMTREPNGCPKCKSQGNVFLHVIRGAAGNRRSILRMRCSKCPQIFMDNIRRTD